VPVQKLSACTEAQCLYRSSVPVQSLSACTEAQCLYRTSVPVQKLSACTEPQCLYRTSVPVQNLSACTALYFYFLSVHFNTCAFVSIVKLLIIERIWILYIQLLFANNVKSTVPCPYFTTLSLNAGSRTKLYSQKQIIFIYSSKYSPIYCFFLFRYLIPNIFLFPTALKQVCHIGRKKEFYTHGKRQAHLQLHMYCFARL